MATARLLLPLALLAASLTGGARGAPDDALDFQKNREYTILLFHLAVFAADHWISADDKKKRRIRCWQKSCASKSPL
jgi:hypothetical protein